MQAAARVMAGKGAIVQVNSEENPRLAARFNISGVPTLLVFRAGKVVNRVSGAMEKNNFIAWWKQQIVL